MGCACGCVHMQTLYISTERYYEGIVGIVFSDLFSLGVFDLHLTAYCEGYLVEAVEKEPGQDPAVRPGMLIIEIAGKPLRLGLREFQRQEPCKSIQSKKRIEC